ncbi:MAG: putative transcriptional regulator [Acidobacteria bacterium OLB17]|nr:MAG: putative transcriptional regulator [Acidobacteria bacterium OLB17]MCZ2391106.1 metalloregulator ArsR/SmtB family transcription factor [Acidobacteriota bacterium]
MAADNDLALCSLFIALSDPTRLKLLRLLAADERSVSFLADSLGESQPKVSRHLAFLRDHDVVTTRRDGKHIYYRICMPSRASEAIFSAIFDLPQQPASFASAEPLPEHTRRGEYMPEEDLPVYLL